MILSWDVFRDDDGWTGVIMEHNPAKRSETKVRWIKTGISNSHNLEKAQEAENRRILNEGHSMFGEMQATE